MLWYALVCSALLCAIPCYALLCFAMLSYALRFGFLLPQVPSAARPMGSFASDLLHIFSERHIIIIVRYSSQKTRPETMAQQHTLRNLLLTIFFPSFFFVQRGCAERVGVETAARRLWTRVRPSQDSEQRSALREVCHMYIYTWRVYWFSGMHVPLGKRSTFNGQRSTMSGQQPRVRGHGSGVRVHGSCLT